MGEKALRSHVDGKKRKKRLEDHGQVKNLFQPKDSTDLAKEPKVKASDYNNNCRFCAGCWFNII